MENLIAIKNVYAGIDLCQVLLNFRHFKGKALSFSFNKFFRIVSIQFSHFILTQKAISEIFFGLS